MYILMLHGTPIAVAERLERLNEVMANPYYQAIDQSAMTIVPDVPVLS